MRQGCEKGWFAHDWIHAKLQRSHAFLPVDAKQIRSLFDNLGSEPPPLRGKNVYFDQSTREVFKIRLRQRDLSQMSVEGLCMKCKTYGPIRDGQKIVMSNGRTRMAGFCSQAGCPGKISKIIS